MRAKPKDAKLAKAFAGAAKDARVGPALHAGEILGDRFRLLFHLGDGTLAGTWRAWDLRDDRDVAVKILQARFISDSGAVGRFEEALSLASGLDHPQICHVVSGVAEYGGFQYAAVEYHAAGSLEDAVATGRISRIGALQAVIDAGRGLAHAHDRQANHGNLSPRNILLGSDGTGLLCDLRLSSRDGHHMGSVYTAPEAAEAGFVPNISADLYALAMTLLFALHGKQLPFWVIRDAQRLIGDLTLDAEVSVALAASVSWDDSERAASVDALLNALLKPDHVLFDLAAHARETGRLSLARDYYDQLLARTDGAPDVRVQLGRVLGDLGESAAATEHLMIALRSDELTDVDGTLLALRTLSEAAGEFENLLDALETRADTDTMHRDALLIEAARIQQQHFDNAAAAALAWRTALDAHKTRAQAAEALAALVASASKNNEWESYVSNGKELIGYLSGERRAELLHQLGRAYLDELGDQQNGLLWLERALEEGFVDPRLAPTLERIRSARGDWPKVLKLMRAQVDTQDAADAAATLRRAVRIARYAIDDVEQVGELYEELLDVAPDDPDALRASAARALADDDVQGAIIALEQLVALPSSPASDSAILAEALVAADRSDDALAVLDAALLVEPGQLACLWASAELLVDCGDLTRATDQYGSIARALEGFEVGEAMAQVQLAIAELAWLNGDGALASQGYHRILERDPDNPQAWWGLSKVAIWAFSDSDPANAWLRATPIRFTPQEALARLLAGIVQPSAAEAWMSLDSLGIACWKACKGRSMLEIGACMVDLMLRRDLVGPGLFEELADGAPEAGVHVEAVRWLWCEDPTDHLFPVAESYRWAMVGKNAAEFDRRIHRSVMYATPPRVSDPAPSPLPWKNHLRDAWSQLFARGAVEELSIERGHVAGPIAVTPAMAPERPRHAVLSFDRWMGERHTIRVHTDEISIGSDPSDHLPCDELEPSQCVVYRRGSGTFYVVGTDIEVDGLWVAERRLEGGEKVQIGPVSFVFHLLETHEPLPEPRFDVAIGDDLDLGMPEIFPEDGPTHQVDGGLEPGPGVVNAAVFFRRDGSECMVPFESDVFVIGRSEDDDVVIDDGGEGFVFRLERGQDGFTIEDRGSAADAEIPAILPLQSGDTFTVGEVVYEFKILDAVPPVITRPHPTSGLPVLVLDDDTRTGTTIPILVDAFTIGRGRTCDLRLSDDAKISRNHATITRAADGLCLLQDHGSSNGTYVNSRRIERHILQVGDKISVGNHRFFFRMGNPADFDDELVLEELDDFEEVSDPIGL